MYEKLEYSYSVPHTKRLSNVSYWNSYKANCAFRKIVFLANYQIV
jgi:hypothetical protein